MSLSIPIISQFNDKGIKAAIKGFQQLETKGQKAAFVLKKAGQAAAVGFAALGVAALAGGKALFDFAQMARQDQLAQIQLAKTIKATTNATDAQIATVETWIDTTARATGVADDELRPALARLVRSTKSTSKAQGLLNTALNISGRTGKPLEAVVNSLAKSYDGSNTALAKLGLGYSKAELKAKSFTDIQKDLDKQFAGGAADRAATFEGTMARLKVTFDELKESAGAAFLPVLQDLATALIPITEAFGKKGLSGAIEELKFQLQFLLYDQQGNLNGVGQQLNDFLMTIRKIQGALSGAGGQALPDALKPRNAELVQLKPQSIDIGALNRRNRQVTTSQGMGYSLYKAQNPDKFNITVNVAPTADLAAVGKEIQKALDANNRRGGK